MKDARIIAALPTKAHSCVLKNNGIFERFSHSNYLAIHTLDNSFFSFVVVK